MYTKLVRYDRWHFLEVDPIRLKRMAVRLREQIYSKVRPELDPYCFYTRTLPVVEAAIKGAIVESIDGDEAKYISRNFFTTKIRESCPVSMIENLPAPSLDLMSLYRDFR